jgi:hypothetical protein
MDEHHHFPLRGKKLKRTAFQVALGSIKEIVENLSVHHHESAVYQAIGRRLFIEADDLPCRLAVANLPEL